MPQDTSSAHGRVSLPDDREGFLNQIWRRSGQRGGCFDVYAWRGEQVLFCEAKRQGKDRIRSSQRRWIEAANRKVVLRVSEALIGCLEPPLYRLCVILWNALAVGVHARKVRLRPGVALVGG